MATYINFSPEEEQALDLARHINKLKTKGQEDNETFYQECSKLLEANKNVELLQKLVDESPILIAESSEKELEGFYLVFIYLVKKLNNQEGSDKIVLNLVSHLTANTEDRPLIRLKILNDLYTLLEEQHQLRFNLYQSIIKYATTSHNAELVIPLFSDINDTRLKEWGLDIAQTRNLYKTIRDILKSSGRQLESYHWSVKYLSTFTEPDTTQIQEAASAALEAIRSPTLLQFDSLLDLPMIKQLETSKDHSKLFQLLRIFVGESFDAYKAFLQENGDYLKSIGLKEEESTRKMRLLSLATLGAANPEISYSLIAKTLQIEEDEVESWVITAMGDGVLHGKMDQLRRVVTVSRCLQRIFTKTQWKQLSDHLAAWKQNTQNLLKTVQESKSQLRAGYKPK